jgi:ATP-independent RNA helicase DbpA
VDLSGIEMLVLDEADRMLDMGFYDDIAEIIGATPRRRQTLLFSATYPDTIKQMSAEFQNDPLDIRVATAVDDVPIEQWFFETGQKQRDQMLADLLAHYQPESAVIFCNTKQTCQDVADALQAKDFHAQALHGDMEQKDRDRVLALFANKSCPLLVATDVAARGLDIKNLTAVINYELAHDPQIHIHRIGRTGRAGKVGLALSLFTPSDAHKMNMIADYQKRPIAYGSADSLVADASVELQPAMVTLCIEGGRKNKVRPGDILGALTGDAGIPGGHVGKIDVFDNHAYVAIESSLANKALKQLAAGTIKGRKFKVKILR